jgi:SAM-dependent methyltransferase
VSFRDYFSAQAAAYSDFRPRYPDTLFAHLATLAPARDAAWDCATGNGQAALGLAAHFHRVVATDMSAAQLANAFADPRVVYARMPAECAALARRSMQLVTVAQALHWLDRGRFYAEARRVLVPEGVLALWCYDLVRIAPPVDALVDRFYTEIVGPYWAPERRIVEDHYRSVEFPFDELTMPSFVIEERWTRPRLAGYLRTWSATRELVRREGRDPVAEIEPALAERWPDEREAKVARWPLHFRVGRTH